MRFIDLFAGLGGFHFALKKLGHQCVFASEIDETLRETYERNFHMEVAGDIRAIGAEKIPSHDILCAGFPCQPFSKARDYEGQSYVHLGDLYKEIIKVIEYHHPTYLILENVPNLARHEYGETLEVITHKLEDEGYSVTCEKLSPHQFGIPQIRERIYIVGSLNTLKYFSWPEPTNVDVSIDSVLDHQPIEARRISTQVAECLDTWQEFLDRVPRDEKIPHPLWAMEFGATYSYKRTTPWLMSTSNLRRRKGAFGVQLSRATERDDVFKLLPSHARTRDTQFPKWKIKFIQRNRDFYLRHKSWLDGWIDKISQFPSSFQKLEWNCQEADPACEIRRIADYVIQIRPSGVRVKRRTTAPSLVAMTATQVPIIGWEQRYMTTAECQRLQSMEGLVLPSSETKAFAALGNAVNVTVVQLVAERLVGKAAENLENTAVEKQARPPDMVQEGVALRVASPS